MHKIPLYGTSEKCRKQHPEDLACRVGIIGNFIVYTPSRYLYVSSEIAVTLASLEMDEEADVIIDLLNARKLYLFQISVTAICRHLFSKCDGIYVPYSLKVHDIMASPEEIEEFIRVNYGELK